MLGRFPLFPQSRDTIIPGEIDMLWYHINSRAPFLSTSYSSEDRIFTWDVQLSWSDANHFKCGTQIMLSLDPNVSQVTFLHIPDEQLVWYFTEMCCFFLFQKIPRQWLQEIFRCRSGTAITNRPQQFIQTSAYTPRPTLTWRLQGFTACPQRWLPRTHGGIPCPPRRPPTRTARTTACTMPSLIPRWPRRAAVASSRTTAAYSRPPADWRVSVTWANIQPRTAGAVGIIPPATCPTPRSRHPPPTTTPPPTSTQQPRSPVVSTYSNAKGFYYFALITICLLWTTLSINFDNFVEDNTTSSCWKLLTSLTISVPATLKFWLRCSQAKKQTSCLEPKIQVKIRSNIRKRLPLRTLLVHEKCMVRHTTQKSAK